MGSFKKFAIYGAAGATLVGVFAGFRWLGGRVAYAQFKASAPKTSRYIPFREVGTVGSDPQSPPTVDMLGFDATRGDGAYVHGRYMNRPDGKTYLSRRIVFPEDGRKVLVFEDVQSVTTSYLPETSPERYSGFRPDPAKGCLGYRWDTKDSKEWTAKEYTQFMGVAVVIVEITIADKDRKTTLTEWRAPSLDCYALRSVMEWKDPTTGAVTSRSDRRATSIHLGEPPQELFDIPNYTERSPISAEEEYFRKFKGGVIDKNLYWTHERQEKTYRDHQKK